MRGSEKKSEEESSGGFFPGALAEALAVVLAADLAVALILSPGFSRQVRHLPPRSLWSLEALLSLVVSAHPAQLCKFFTDFDLMPLSPTCLTLYPAEKPELGSHRKSSDHGQGLEGSQICL